MPAYLFTARTPEGKSITNRITSESLESARRALAASGCSDIRFHTNDDNLRLEAAIRGELDPNGEFGPLTASQDLQARRGGGFLAQLRGVWQANSLFLWPLALSGVTGYFLSRALGHTDPGSALRIGLVTLIVLLVATPGIAYQALLRAVVWNRLWETRFWAGFLRLLRLPGGGRIPPVEIDVRHACVLARHGRTEAGRQLLEPHLSRARNDNDLLGLTLLPSFYDAAGEYDAAHELRCRATALSGNVISQTIDQALGLARYLRRPAEARQCLDRIAGRELVELAQVFVTYVEGLIALNEQRYAEATTLLERAEAVAAPFAAHELMNGMRREMWAYQSLALAGTGRFAEARALLAKARPLLEARRETSLLQRCDAAIPRQGGT